jgi:hypothetical protein
MTIEEITSLRIRNQQIEASNIKTPKELAGWMGAIQAQDFAMAKWAIGLRVPESTEKTIEQSYNSGDILRTHLMRPTWHFVSPDDVYWLLELSAPQIRKVLRTNDKRFELTETVYAAGNNMLEKVLSGGKSLTREELVQEYDAIHIRTNENRLSHMLVRAEQDGVVCSGPLKGNKLTYALLAERVPTKKAITRDEALVNLATRYFKSHSPASFRDFVWWSGLTITDARKAYHMIQSCFVSETIGNETYLFTNNFTNTPPANLSVHLLPAFDEYLIAYANRSAALEGIDNKKTISDNGIFRPIIVINGQVRGLWKRTTKKDKAFIETEHFQPFDTQTIKAIDQEIKQYGIFLDKKTEIMHQELHKQ